MGANNAQGIYVYDETDKASPVSTLLNKLGTSITTVVTGIRTRLTALEKAQPVLVVNGRYTVRVTNQAAGAVTAWPLPALVAKGSSTGAGTVWTPQAGGLRFKQKGIYLIAVRAKPAVAISGRVFVDVTIPNEDPVRLDRSPTTEDNLLLTGTLIVPVDDVSVAIASYHNTVATLTTDFRIDVTRIGTLN